MVRVSFSVMVYASFIVCVVWSECAKESLVAITFTVLGVSYRLYVIIRLGYTRGVSVCWAPFHLTNLLFKFKFELAMF